MLQQLHKNSFKIDLTPENEFMKMVLYRDLHRNNDEKCNLMKRKGVCDDKKWRLLSK